MRNDIDENMDRDGGKGGRLAPRKKALSAEVIAKVDYKSPQVLKAFVTDRGKMIPRRISGASAGQQRIINTAIRRARMLALLPFSVSGD